MKITIREPERSQMKASELKIGDVFRHNGCGAVKMRVAGDDGSPDGVPYVFLHLWTEDGGDVGVITSSEPWCLVSLYDAELILRERLGS